MAAGPGGKTKLTLRWAPLDAVPTIQYRAAGEPMKGAAISKTATAAQATTLQCQTSRISVRSRSELLDADVGKDPRLAKHAMQ